MKTNTNTLSVVLTSSAFAVLRRDKPAPLVSGFTLGLDLGDRSHHVCVLDAAGQIIREGALSNTRPALAKLLSDFPRATVAMEAGTHSPWISRYLTGLGAKVIVANNLPQRIIGVVHGGIGQFLELLHIVAAINDAGIEEGAWFCPTSLNWLRHPLPLPRARDIGGARLCRAGSGFGLKGLLRWFTSRCEAMPVAAQPAPPQHLISLPCRDFALESGQRQLFEMRNSDCGLRKATSCIQAITVSGRDRIVARMNGRWIG